MPAAHAYYKKIQGLVKKHESWFSECLPLVASENVTSGAVRRVLASDLGHRYAEGEPRNRIYAGCEYIDGIEEIATALGKKVFGADFVDIRPISGLVANLAVYSALTEPGDSIMALATSDGGHISSGPREQWGSAGLVHGLRVRNFAFDAELMNIDVDGTIRALEREGKDVKLAMFGASLFLFPHPLKELAGRLSEAGAVICYDAAHVAGLIGGGRFQDPLREGAEIMTFSTHKSLFGPQGGAIVARSGHEDMIKNGVFPGTTSNHHPHSSAAKAVAFAEMLQFGASYARDVIANARALATRLAELGERVIGERGGYTRSHQVVLDASRYGGGIKAEKTLERMNVIVNRQGLPRGLKTEGPAPAGIRLGVTELTRLGFGRSDMVQVAEILHGALGGRPAREVIRAARELRKDSQTVRYSFDNSPAYLYPM